MFILLATALIGPAIVPYDPLLSNVSQALHPPSWQHWAGTDQIGRDVFARLLVATQLDLLIVLSAVFLSLLIGAITGALVGYYGGWADKLVGRAVDILMSFPLFILAMLLVAAVGSGVSNIIYATAIINLPFYIRVTRSEINSRKSSGWVEAARLSGNGHGRIILNFLMPSILPILAVQVSLNLGWALLNAAALSFLGLGIQPPTPEWGIMIAEGAQYITSSDWWLVVCPGAMLMFVVLTFNAMGDRLRNLFDPRQRQ
ncbi:ABC transporter permease [Xylophilus sp.]|uniref:ABC transporter permease n=1 Tax=Xylophilus sp. TaxID=2653893 RepID=UPI002D805A83|nr:ABC transporter permease [Xylophilus sp.]